MNELLNIFKSLESSLKDLLFLAVPLTPRNDDSVEARGVLQEQKALNQALIQSIQSFLKNSSIQKLYDALENKDQNTINDAISDEAIHTFRDFLNNVSPTLYSFENNRDNRLKIVDAKLISSDILNKLMSISMWMKHAEYHLEEALSQLPGQLTPINQLIQLFKSFNLKQSLYTKGQERILENYTIRYDLSGVELKSPFMETLHRRLQDTAASLGMMIEPIALGGLQGKGFIIDSVEGRRIGALQLSLDGNSLTLSNRSFHDLPVEQIARVKDLSLFKPICAEIEKLILEKVHPELDFSIALDSLNKTQDYFESTTEQGLSQANKHYHLESQLILDSAKDSILSYVSEQPSTPSIEVDELQTLIPLEDQDLTLIGPRDYIQGLDSYPTTEINDNHVIPLTPHQKLMLNERVQSLNVQLKEHGHKILYALNKLLPKGSINNMRDHAEIISACERAALYTYNGAQLAYPVFDDNNTINEDVLLKLYYKQKELLYPNGSKSIAPTTAAPLKEKGLLSEESYRMQLEATDGLRAPDLAFSCTANPALLRSFINELDTTGIQGLQTKKADTFWGSKLFTNTKTYEVSHFGRPIASFAFKNNQLVVTMYELRFRDLHYITRLKSILNDKLGNPAFKLEGPGLKDFYHQLQTSQAALETSLNKKNQVVANAQEEYEKETETNLKLFKKIELQSHINEKNALESKIKQGESADLILRNVLEPMNGTLDLSPKSSSLPKKANAPSSLWPAQLEDPLGWTSKYVAVGINLDYNSSNRAKTIFSNIKVLKSTFEQEKRSLVSKILNFFKSLSGKEAFVVKDKDRNEFTVERNGANLKVYSKMKSWSEHQHNRTFSDLLKFTDHMQTDTAAKVSLIGTNEISKLHTTVARLQYEAKQIEKANTLQIKNGWPAIASNQQIDNNRINVYNAAAVLTDLTIDLNHLKRELPELEGTPLSIDTEEHKATAAYRAPAPRAKEKAWVTRYKEYQRAKPSRTNEIDASVSKKHLVPGQRRPR